MAEGTDNADAQIQEETISSLTEDLKSKVQNEMKQNGGGETVCDEKAEVETSDNRNGESETSETNGHKVEDEAKAENVSSTEQSTGEAKGKESAEGKEADEKKTEEAQKKDQPLSSTVAKHYNQIPAGSKEGRKQSRIFYLRNFNNWVKSVIINEFLEKVKRRKRTSDEINILDLCCGKGGDLLKWDKGRVDHVIMADIAATSIDQCKERYSKLERDRRRSHSRERVFATEFFAADCTKEILSQKYKKSDIKLDLTSCQFAFHYSFESYEQADTMLRNACENLRVGGYFIGTTADSNKLVKRIKECKEADSFGNSVFNIKSSSRDHFPLFGAKYMFYLEGVVDCPEFLVHLPTMEALAAKYNMKLVWKKNFHEIFKEYERDHAHLLNKMNALETYPASGDKTLTGVSESQYKSACDYLEKKSCKQVGTLSADEWEVAGLYIAFAFEKIAPEKPSSSHDRDSRKRHRDHSSDKRRSDSSSSKRSRKEEQVSTTTEEVYEIKDEIYDAEADMEEPTPSSSTTSEVVKAETEPKEQAVDDTNATSTTDEGIAGDSAPPVKEEEPASTVDANVEQMDTSESTAVVPENSG